MRSHRIGVLGSAVLAAVCFVAAPAAQANTYLFTFSTSDILAALEASQGTAVFNTQGYFALFLKPNYPQITSYTYGAMTSPKPAGADQWEALPVTNPGGTVPAGDYAQFSKLNGQALVTLMTGAPAWTNVFGNGGPHQYSDNGSYPVFFGGTLATLNSQMSNSALMSFYVNTPDVLTIGSTVSFQGYASAITSFHSDGFYDLIPGQIGPGKTDIAIPFTISAAAAVPEPATLMTMGAALILIGGLRKRFHHRRKTGF